jgi:putative sugar O-methyltransferase
LAPETYKATERWQRVRDQHLGPIIQALTTRDIAAVRKMYSNFFRDSCSAGLLAAPFGMSKAYFGGAIKDIHRRFYLSHVLYRLDYWKEQTATNFVLSDLAAPPIGNPFGVLIDGTLLRVGAEYAHYCAYRVGGFLGTGKAIVAEIGGGFGGMAYYLLRDTPKMTYCDFDVPESIALTSYYLLKGFPQLKFLLYGEGELTKDGIARADVVLMPMFTLAAMPPESVNVTFSSHGMSDINQQAMVEYMNNIIRMTRHEFLYIGNGRATKSISDLVCESYDSFQLTEARSSGWHSHKVSGAGVGGAAGLAASTLFEQCYTRTIAAQNE